jgi:hypothetical protein
LLDFANVLKRRQPRFALTDLTDSDLEKLCLQAIGRTPAPGDRLYEWSSQLVEGHIDLTLYRRILAKTFYEVGLVGMRVDPTRQTSWSFLHREPLKEAEIGALAELQICPMFYRVLGTEVR